MFLLGPVPPARGAPFGKEVMPMRKRKKGSHVSIAWLAVVTTALIALTALLQLVGAAVGLAHH